MPRVKRGVQAHARHKKVLKSAKGYYGARSKVYRVAKRNQSHRRHILTKKSTKRKRQLRSPSMLHKSDVAAARRMIPYA